jgi:hypothetical protein
VVTRLMTNRNGVGCSIAARSLHGGVDLHQGAIAYIGKNVSVPESTENKEPHP